MPFFGSSGSAGQSMWEVDVETATAPATEKPVEVIYAAQFAVIDKLKSCGTTERRDLVRAILKRAAREPSGLASCSFFLDTLLINAGKPMQLEISTREVCDELFKLGMRFNKSDHQNTQTALGYFRKWSRAKELRDDAQLDLIVRLYKRFKQEGVVHERPRYRASESAVASAPNPASHAPSSEATETARFEEDLKKALQLSLEEEKRRTAATSNTRSLYASLPSADSHSFTPAQPAQAPSAASNKAATATATIMVTAVYDFESAEKDELSFHAGDQIALLDDSDKCWWKGRFSGREGFFPALFVTKEAPTKAAADTKLLPAGSGNPNPAATTVVPVPAGPRRLDVTRIQRCLELQSAADVEQVSDPDAERELCALEADCAAMTDSLTTELELCDRRLNEIGELEAEYNKAYELYAQVLKEQQERETARRMAAAQYASWQQQQQQQQQAAAWYSQQPQPAAYYPPPPAGAYAAPPPAGAYAPALPPFAQPHAAAPLAYPVGSYQPQPNAGFQPYPDANQNAGYRPVSNASLSAFYEQATLPYPAP